MVTTMKYSPITKITSVTNGTIIDGGNYNMKIFTYWEGPKPPYIELCLESIKKINKQCDVHIVTPKNIHYYLNHDEIDHEILKNPLLKRAQKVDYIRILLIHKFGGMWLDADTIAIKDLYEFERCFIDYDFCYMKWDDGRILNGYFYCKEKSELTNEWINMIHVKRNLKHFTWTEFGEKITSVLIKNPKFKSRQLNRSIFIPINFDKNPRLFFDSNKIQSYINSKTFCVALNHSWFVDHTPNFVEMSLDEIETKNNIMGLLIKQTRKILGG